MSIENEATNTTVGDVLGEVRQLLGSLEGKRAYLVEARDELSCRIAELEEQRDQYDSAIAEVDKVLGPMKTTPQPRKTGVKQLAEKVLRDLSEPVQVEWVPQAEIIRVATERDPTMKDHSLVSGLGRLLKEEVCERRGKRGHYEYRLSVGGQSTASSNQPEATESVEATADPVEVIMAKIDDAGVDGCTKKDLAWAVGDQVAIDNVLDHLVLHGEVKSKNVGESIHYVRAPRVAEPQPLFGGKVDEDVPPAAS